MVEENLKQFIELKALTIKGVEDASGLKQSTLSKALKNGGALGSDKLEKILTAYPELSAEWLMRGKGPMLKGPALPYDPDKELLDMCGLLLEVNRQKENVMSMIEKLVKLSKPDE